MPPGDSLCRQLNLEESVVKRTNTVVGRLSVAVGITGTALLLPSETFWADFDRKRASEKSLELGDENLESLQHGHRTCRKIGVFVA